MSKLRFWQWAAIATAYAGVVAAQCDSMFCSMEYAPVCGSDGVLYENKCLLAAASCSCDYCVSIVKDCASECLTTTANNAPCSVQGADGCSLTTCKEYRGRGEMTVTTLVAQQHRASSDITNCVLPCRYSYKPVCGSDGRDYENQCKFEIARCLSDSKMTVVKSGLCSSTEDETATTPTTSSDDECARWFTMDYSPVCGSDGKTYASSVVLEVVSCQSGYTLSKVSNGRCALTTSAAQTSWTDQFYSIVPYAACQKPCPVNLKYVCGSDGLTYPNPCFFEIAVCQSGGELVAASQGICPVREVTETSRSRTGGSEAGSDGCDITCPMQYDPVCGSDGNTYGSACLLSLANCQSNGEITNVSSGECEDHMVAIAMVAGAPRSQWAASIPALSPGLTTEKTGCERPCKAIYSPVCGTDGRTYPNECALEIASCLVESGLSKAHDGACDYTDLVPVDAVSAMSVEEDECVKACTKVSKAVCGSDGHTYENVCMLENANCQSAGEISVASDGPCPAVETGVTKSTTNCVRPCTGEYAPVCGTNGQTYSNNCVLEIAICLYSNSFGKARDGACTSTATAARPSPAGGMAKGRACERTCPVHYSPWCGSDGETYSNECLLNVAVCQSGGVLKKVKAGECDTVSGGSTAAATPTTSVESLGCLKSCAPYIRPVCGTNGRTYANDCVLGISACLVGSDLAKGADGACVPSATDLSTPASPCDAVCPARGPAVCGSDGVTYGNRCQLAVANCRLGTDVTVVAARPCAGGSAVEALPPDFCDVECDADSPSVCGEDGRTYASECQLWAEACRNNRTNAVAHEGPCHDLSVNAPTLPYVRCRQASHCASVFGGPESSWYCFDPMVCRPVSCTLNARWLAVSCGVGDCTNADGTTSMDSLGYCRPKDAVVATTVTTS